MVGEGGKRKEPTLLDMCGVSGSHVVRSLNFHSGHEEGLNPEPTSLSVTDAYIPAAGEVVMPGNLSSFASCSGLLGISCLWGLLGAS